MVSFALSLNKRNMAIAEAIRRANEDYVKIDVQEDKIIISFGEGLHIDRLELGPIGVDLTDNDWVALCKEIKRSLKGGKVRDFNSMLIGIHPLKTEVLTLRLSPLEKAQILDAAKIEHENITNFVRVAALRRAGEVFDRETLRRMEERSRAEAKKETYVS